MLFSSIIVSDPITSNFFSLLLMLFAFALARFRDRFFQVLVFRGDYCFEGGDQTLIADFMVLQAIYWLLSSRFDRSTASD